MGLDVEMEHGSRDPDTDVTRNDEILTGKIAWAHLKELPDYYTRLAVMEGEAKRTELNDRSRKTVPPVLWPLPASAARRRGIPRSR